MKATKIMAMGLFMAGSALLASCYQRNDYNTNPNNNNNYNNNYNNHSGTPNYTYVFDEEFNGPDNYGWTFTNATDSAYASISGGYYQYVDYSSLLSNMSVVNTGANVQDSFTVQASIKSNKMMALVFGASATSNGYAFYIDTAGNYSLYQEGTDTTASTVVIASTADSSAAKDNWNILEISQAGGNWTGSINGIQVFQVAAHSLSGARFGFKILPGTVGYADYITVKSF